jgi:8-oxo-dGTP pyrophosphatase MutT (NUDIX family)
MKKVTTLAIIEDGDRVLLAMKKRGFGEGWWNGYGGKVQEDETIPEAMIRELEEESGLRAEEFSQRGVLNFFFVGSNLESDLEVEMHIFEVTKYSGELIETDEMLPQWFSKKEIPYKKMWPADGKWMPIFFSGKKVTGSASFDAQTKGFIRSDFKAA